MLVGVDGTGAQKRVCQYHWDGENWLVGAAARKVPYNLPDVLETIRIGLPIYIVEGEKDADTLGAYKITATTNPCGAGSWPKDKAFNRYFEGADVIIIPDNDLPGRMHANEVAQTLKGIAKRIRVLTLPGLPEKGDVTDWVNLGNDITLLERLSKDPRWVKELEVSYPNLAATSAAPRAEWLDERGRIITARLGGAILRQLPVMYYKGVVYVYKDGVYRPHGEMEIRRLAQKMLGEHSRSTYVEEALKWICNERYVEPDHEPNPDDGLINVKNGLLDWKTGALKPHSPERFSTIQIPVVYDPTAKSLEIEQFFKDVLPEDVVPLMYEIFGYCLVPTARFQKAFLLTGEGSNGKSTLINLLSAFVGSENVTNIPLHDLEHNRFKLAGLRDKLVNTFADLQYRALEKSSTFKSVVSGDRVNAEYKGKDAFDFRPFAKLIFSANELPSSRDVSKAFFRRWIVIPFPYTFGNGPNDKKPDPTLEERLKFPENLSALLNLAVEGLRRLDRRGGFQETPSTRKALEDYIRDADSVAAFIDECVAQSGTVATKALYAAYEQWCVDSGVHPLKKVRFNKRLQEYFPGLKKKRAHGGSEYWVGITVLNG
ncbi:phage/plasmid primase, P4 family [Alicyclobacillus herbarius]|uniref:phage/plasmid primase, P4 family n=1 Tax=Alicyclobacillus herbarius TaxID=122960 RepID=UPI001FE00E35|nr:phage/plasmid primase, P4 family [Alicyclobacillus herbarius]